MNLPPFSKDARCPKCASIAIGSKNWKRKITEAEAERTEQLSGYILWPGPERVTRYCRECGYSWFEQPLDANVHPLGAIKHRRPGW